jgi:diacylglycerol O-acyltransferase
MTRDSTKYHLDALSMTDYSMLVAEDSTHPMHVAAVTLFEGDKLSKADGGIDFNTLRKSFAVALPQLPRYRQKLMWQDSKQTHAGLSSPGWLELMREQPPVWIDDTQFDINYHLRHMALPKPGNDVQLKTLIGRLLETPLDRSRPLWEAYAIEGMRNGNIAVLIKVHHCLVDGIGGVGLAQNLLSIDPDKKPGKVATFNPRPAPTLADLRREGLNHKFQASREAMENLGMQFLKPAKLLQNTEKAFKSFKDVLGSNAGMTRSDTPINGELGLHRNTEWLETSLKDIKTIKNTWNCSINDALLVIVTGAMGEYLAHRDVDVNKTPFRVGMPISLRSKGDDSEGNQISFKLLELPIAETRLDKQLARIREQTGNLNRDSQALVTQTLMSVVEYVPAIMPMLARGFAGAGNCYLTNIPGPGFPLYQAGAKMVSMIPLAPLNGTMGLCIAAMSYNGKISWGLSGDPDLLPDLDLLAQMIADSKLRALKSVRAKSATKSRGRAKKASMPRRAKTT